MTDRLSTVPPGSAQQTTLDHLALGVRQWSDGYERFIMELGGRWVRGGPAGDVAPYQLGFGDCMQLEFVAPLAPGGAMERFLERRGPAPHHITFKVASLEAGIAEFRRFGFETFGGRPDLPMWREAFVHPKHTGLGTLVQIVEADDEFIVRESTAAPGGQQLWAHAPSEGAAFLVFGPGDLTASALEARACDLVPMPHHAATAIPMWLL
jgi:hypothetical protein